MNDLEYVRTLNVLTAHLSPCPCSREYWVISGAEDAYEEMRTRAALTAAEAMARATAATPIAAPASVVLPAPLAQALREVSCAPAVHALLALLEGGVAPALAQALVDAADDLQMEEDIRNDQRPWGWSHWLVSAEELTWVTCSRATEVTLTATGARLTRRAGGGEVITGEWRWGAGGELLEAWADPDDCRSEHLGGLLGELRAHAHEAAEEGEERELEAREREAREREAAAQAVYRRGLRARRRNGGRGNPARSKARRDARRHKARQTWDQPVA